MIGDPIQVLLVASGSGGEGVERDLSQSGVARFVCECVHEKDALAGNPRHAWAREYLRNHYWVLAEALIRLGDHAEAARTAEEVPRLSPGNSMHATIAASATPLQNTVRLSVVAISSGCFWRCMTRTLVCCLSTFTCFLSSM